MTINVIVAVSDNGVIGKDGKIPWKMSTDMKRFKEITTGHTVVMGRKTWEFLGGPLDNRRNVIVTHCTDPFGHWSKEGYIESLRTYAIDRQYVSKINSELWAVGSLEGSFDLVVVRPDDTYADIFVIGGQQIYDEIFKTPELIHRVYLTRVHCGVEDGDAFFRRNFPVKKYVKRLNEKGVLEDVDWKDGAVLGIKNDNVCWELISEEFIPKSDKDEYDSTFQVWENRG